MPCRPRKSLTVAAARTRLFKTAEKKVVFYPAGVGRASHTEKQTAYTYTQRMGSFLGLPHEMCTQCCQKFKARSRNLVDNNARRESKFGLWRLLRKSTLGGNNFAIEFAMGCYFLTRSNGNNQENNPLIA